MSHATVIPPGAGEVIGDAPDRRVEILCEADPLDATWSRFGPRREGADLHVHRRHTDLFYVLDGELGLRLGADVAVPVGAGALARVPPLVVHGFRNAGDAEVRYLNLHAPGRGFAAYLRALRDGRTPSFDQEPPPLRVRPAAGAVVGRGEVLADGPHGRTILLADTEEIAIAEVRVQPGAPERAAHVHRRHLECFYVLEGELLLAVGGRVLRAAAGSWIRVPAGVPHGAPVARGQPVRVLDVHAPGAGFGAFVRASLAGGDEDRAAARTAFDRHPAP